MPAHYTHMYTARRVADDLLSGHFPDWPAVGDALNRHSPQECGTVMKNWEKFTALGAVGSSFVGKIFMGEDFQKARELVRARYGEVRVIRPEGTRSNSYELFLVGLAKKG